MIDPQQSSKINALARALAANTAGIKALSYLGPGGYATDMPASSQYSLLNWEANRRFGGQQPPPQNVATPAVNMPHRPATGVNFGQPGVAANVPLPPVRPPNLGIPPGPTGPAMGVAPFLTPPGPISPMNTFGGPPSATVATMQPAPRPPGLYQGMVPPPGTTGAGTPGPAVPYAGFTMPARPVSQSPIVIGAGDGSAAPPPGGPSWLPSWLRF